MVVVGFNWVHSKEGDEAISIDFLYFFRIYALLLGWKIINLKFVLYVSYISRSIYIYIYICLNILCVGSLRLFL